MENAEQGKKERVDRSIERIKQVLEEEQCTIEPFIGLLGSDGKISFDSRVVVVARNLPLGVGQKEVQIQGEGVVS